jgi:glycosyltransferase involved in cell wall biosynthesis
MVIRVCQLITDLRLSGAERVVYELSRRLDRSRFDVRVASLRGGEVEQMLLAAGIPVTVLGVRGKWDVGKFLPLYRLLRQERIDLLHTHLFHSDLAGRTAALLADVPHLVHTIHVAEQRYRPWQYAYARLMDFKCDRLICVSQSVRDHHAAHSHLPLSRYAVIPNGVDMEAFGAKAAPYGPVARARTRQQWGLSPRQLAVLFVGRLNHQKGIDVLLAAMSQLADHGGLPKRGADKPPELRFVLAGDGPERPMVERYMAQGAGPSGAGMNCRLLGFVSDIREALNAADIFVLPSRWEGWPLALAEAMAAGLPCVGTDVPGIRDIVAGGRTGLLVPSQDPAALAGAIGDLAADPAMRDTLAAAGQQEILTKYSIQKNIAAHEKLYLEVAGG